MTKYELRITGECKQNLTENLQEAGPADAGTVGCCGQVAARREARREVSGSPTARQPQGAVGMPHPAQLAPCLGAE